jgi:hypothetical protein
MDHHVDALLEDRDLLERTVRENISKLESSDDVSAEAVDAQFDRLVQTLEEARQSLFPTRSR